MYGQLAIPGTARMQHSKISMVRYQLIEEKTIFSDTVYMLASVYACLWCVG